MNRRKFIQATAVVAPVLYSAKLFAQEAKTSESIKTGGKYGALIDSASDCVKKGELCLSHCIDMMAGGDKSMGPCAKTVRDMLAVCQASIQLAMANSEFAKKQITVCLDVCKKCEDECRKHPKHKVCMNCAESCKSCIAEMNKILA